MEDYLKSRLNFINLVASSPEKMNPLYINTPLIVSKPLSTHLGREVMLKVELLQPSGSFKNRGIGHYCLKAARDGIRYFVSASGGNAGLAVAYSGRELGIPVTVVIPKTTPLFMREKIMAEGAEVVIHGENLNEAATYAKQLAADKAGLFISPYDHPAIWEGHASLVHEIARTGKKPGAMILSVGGGGLLCGVIQGLHEVGWKDVPVFTVETEGAASFAKSVEKNQIVTLDGINTVATSLGLRRVTDQAFHYTKTHRIHPFVVSDKEAVDAAFRFLDHHKFMLEPACAVCLVPIYRKDPLLQPFSSIHVVLCGGNVVTLELLQKWRNEQLT